MKLKDIISYVCMLNGELCRLGDFLSVEKIGSVATRDEVERVTFWCNMEQEYGEREIRKIMPLDFCNLRVVLK